MERTLKSLSVTELLAAQKKGACILDVRHPDDYCRLHLKGSINIGLGGKLENWAGSLLDAEQPLVLVADPGRESEAVQRLGRVRLNQVWGYLEGGADALTPQDDWTDSLERIDSEELQQRLTEDEPLLLLDVRTPGEHTTRRMPGTLHVPLNELAERSHELPEDNHLVVYCGSGYRSTIACSMLKASGHHQLTDLAGGIQAWTGPVESD